MEAEIEGYGFNGPDTFIAKAYQTTHYPLLFRPQFEGSIEVSVMTLSCRGDNQELRLKFDP